VTNIHATVGSIKLGSMDPEEAVALLLRCAYLETDSDGGGEIAL